MTLPRKRPVAMVSVVGSPSEVVLVPTVQKLRPKSAPGDPARLNGEDGGAPTLQIGTNKCRQIWSLHGRTPLTSAWFLCFCLVSRQRERPTMFRLARGRLAASSHLSVPELGVRLLLFCVVVLFHAHGHYHIALRKGERSDTEPPATSGTHTKTP